MPAKRPTPNSVSTTAPQDEGEVSEGIGVFIEIAEAGPAEWRDTLFRLARWAEGLMDEGLATVHTYRGPLYTTLRPRIQPDDVGIATVSINTKGPALRPWRTVMERRAPASIARVEAAIAPMILTRQKITIREISEELLDALTEAYREAARR